MLVVPRAQARLVPGDDRWSLVEEAALATDPSSIIDSNTIYIPDWGQQWVSESRYVLDDMSAFVAIARSSVGADITRSNSFQPFDCANWPNQRIYGLVVQNGEGWGGQCLSFVSLLLLRSGCVTDHQILISYADLETASESIRTAQPGDIAFRNQGGDSHIAVVIKVDDKGILLADSNYHTPQDERIRMHYLTWGVLAAGGYEAADLDALLGYLRRQNRPIPLCPTDPGPARSPVCATAGTLASSRTRRCQRTPGSISSPVSS